MLTFVLCKLIDFQAHRNAFIQNFSYYFVRKRNFTGNFKRGSGEHSSVDAKLLTRKQMNKRALNHIYVFAQYLLLFIAPYKR